MSAFGNMMKFVLSLIIILLITFMNTFSAQVVAQVNFGAAISTMKVNQQSNKQQVRVKSSNQAAQMAQSRYGGKVLKVQAKKSGYRVKLIKKDGYIIAVFVDAKSGQISGR
ncbi:MAG: putative membrane protein YkoI [Colwellia sp.]|jgi:uncharacterized membrane protein YkoI